ncbi:MAG: PilW family protein [Gammaproteobacteria bacterium]
MKYLNTQAGKQKGLSIVELMVALVLSLVVLLVTTSIYVSNKQTYRFLDQYSMLQENGRFAIFFLREHILQAGFPRQAGVDPFPTLPTNNTVPASDSIIVQFRSAVDCLNDVPAGALPLKLTQNTFQINANSLQCNGNGLVGGVDQPAQVLVEGIESLQAVYGVDTDADGIANTYADSAQVEGGIITAGTPDWDNVVSMRVAVLVQGQPNILDTAQAFTYNLLGQDYTPSADRTPRRVFTTTIPLRNRNRTII